MTAINPYLSFNGNCEEAFSFYHSVFGGSLALCRFKDAPAGTMPVAENEKELVMHCSLPIGSTTLMGADMSENCGPRATFGNNITINFCPDSEDEAKRIFASLADGGKVLMPLEKTFWAALFGVLVDQFGIPWMVNYDEPVNFDVTVVECSAKHLVGMKVRTNMQKASVDCPTIWQTFGPRMAELPCACSEGAYGVSVMLNENEFDYWGAVEVASGTPLPSEMHVMELPAGLYAKCTVPCLEKLGDAYNMIYGSWAHNQNEYSLNMQVPSFELYGKNWQVTASFEIYAPVIKK